MFSHKLCRPSPLNLIPKILILLFLLHTQFLYGGTKIRHSKFVVGSSLRFKLDSWASLQCSLQNTGKSDAKVLLKVFPSTIPKTSDMPVFQEEVLIPANSQVEYYSPIYVSTKNKEYIVELHDKGRRVDKKDMLVEVLDPTSKMVLTLDDGLDTESFNYTKIPDYKDKVFNAIASASNFPTESLILKSFGTLILLRPNYERLTPAQYAAIDAFVFGGGTLVFADSIGVIEAAKTPLAHLLPVKPLGLRKIEKLDCLKDWSVSRKVAKFSRKIDFIESVANSADGITILREKDLPVIRWKKYGLGSCRFSAISISNEIFNNDMTLIKNYADKLLNLSDKRSYKEDVKPELDKMTDFEIPSIQTVIAALIGYGVLLVILGMGMKFLNKPIILWPALSLSAIVAALIITVMATSRGGSDVRLNDIKVVVKGENSDIYDSYCAAFAGSETSITVLQDNPNGAVTTFPAITPLFIDFKKRKSKLKNSMILSVDRIGGNSGLKDTLLEVNKPKQFVMNGTDDSRLGKYEHPVIEYSSEAPVLKGWKFPKGISGTEAYLICPGAVYKLHISGSGVSETKLVKSYSSSFIDSLHKGYSSSTPAVAVIRKSKDTSLIVEGAAYNGKEVQLFPVVREFKSKRIKLSFGDLIISPMSRATKTQMNGNFLKDKLNSRMSTDLFFKIQLPEILSDSNIKKMSLDFKYSNASGALDITPGYQKSRTSKKSRNNVMKFRKQGESYNIPSKDLSRIFRKGDDYGVLALSVKKKKIKDYSQAMKAGIWKVQELDIVVECELSNKQVPFKY